MIATVFCGPSIPRGEARALAPSVVFRPPAAQGDLLTAVERDGAEVLGLIDGTFHQSLSVWHNEVCYLLSRGISIYGASSMGALRAVETNRYGMVGIGTVFRWYLDGSISGDDEVALLHADESVDFRPLSIPMVNIRASLAAAVQSGKMLQSTAARVLQISASLFYADRLLPVILERCYDAGLEEACLPSVRQALSAEYVDVKRADAVELLSRISAIVEGGVERDRPPVFEFKRSSLFETLYNVDRNITIRDGEISLERIAEHFALYSPDYDKIRKDAINRSIAIYLGYLMEITPTQADIDDEEHRFTQDRKLNSAGDLQNWLRRNAFSYEDLRFYLREECIYRKLEDWVVKSRPFDRGCKRLLDELRLNGTFAFWASEAYEKAVIVDAYGSGPEYRAVTGALPAQLAKLHADSGYVRITGDAQKWAEYLGFESAGTLSDALERAVIFNDVKNRISRQLIRMAQAANLTEDE
jgi:hypothetical protein